MISKNLCNAAAEFNIILKKSSPEIIQKIPKSFLDFLEKIESKSYSFVYDNSKTLGEQNIKPETRGLIAIVYREYLCNEEEKNNYIIKYRKHIAKKELELREKYDPGKIFKTLEDNTSEKNNSTELSPKNELEKKLETSKEDITRETSVIEYKKKNIFQKLLYKIKKYFNNRED